MSTMAKGMISEISEGIQRRVGNKFRKSLQTLQVSADEERLIGGNMVHPDDKISVKEKQSQTIQKAIVEEKENVLVRRSKRTKALQSVTYAESPDEPKTAKCSAKNVTKAKKPASKSKKGRSTTKNNEQKSSSNQTRLNFSPVPVDTVKENSDNTQCDNQDKNVLNNSTEDNEDSGFDPTYAVPDLGPFNSTVVMRTPTDKSSSIVPDSEISIITADNPPLSYWRTLAEQRRIALEKALYENELLHDQLTVLEAENAQLKQLVREAENLAQVVRAIVD